MIRYEDLKLLASSGGFSVWTIIAEDGLAEDYFAEGLFTPRSALVSRGDTVFVKGKEQTIMGYIREGKDNSLTLVRFQ